MKLKIWKSEEEHKEEEKSSHAFVFAADFQVTTMRMLNMMKSYPQLGHAQLKHT